ncbi:MAG: chemotaxis protein CheW [Candidatus Riflebacteria bacterium]|nr:chemotaxis protein CheW [Candidatus Riflebacteria bacterium]
MSAVGPIVLFEVGDSRYGIDIQSIVEVVSMVALTPIPSLSEGAAAQAAVAGLVDVRGQVMPVLDLRLLFGRVAAQATTLTRIMISTLGEESVGLVVDSVYGVVEPVQENVSPVDRKGNPGAMEVITHVYRDSDGLVLIVGLEKLLAGLDLRVIDRGR